MRPATPGMARTEPAAQRAAVLSQLQHLVDEAGATKPLVARLPSPVLQQRPTPDAPSVTELYCALAAWDSEVFLPLVRRMVAEDVPRHAEPAPMPEQAQEGSIGAVLDRVLASRQALVAFVRDLPSSAWNRQAILWGRRYDLFGILHLATQHTTEILRSVAGQLNARL